jgi:molybdopterin converting factor small subunit
MRIHFYGGIGDRLGRSVEFDLPDDAATVGDLRRLLSRAYPDAAGEIASRLRACVGDEIVGEAYELSRADTVEFLPPLSGG